MKSPGRNSASRYGPVPDRGNHADRLAGARALRPLEEVAREQPAAGERGGPEGLRLLEDELHGVGVDLLDPRDVIVGRAGARRGGGIDRELPVEDHVVGGERGAVVPEHVALEPPRHPLAVLGQRARLAVGQLLGQDRHEGAVGGGGGERLVEDPLDREVAEAAAEVRVQQGGRVPHQHAERAAAAAPGGRELGLARLRGGQARRAQESARDGAAEPGRGERLHEAPARETAVLHLREHLPEGRFVHGFPVGGPTPIARGAGEVKGSSRLSRREESGTIRRRPSGPGDRPPMNLVSERLDIDDYEEAVELFYAAELDGRAAGRAPHAAAGRGADRRRGPRSRRRAWARCRRRAAPRRSRSWRSTR